MIMYHSCKTAIQNCMDSHTFTAAHLYNTEQTMNIHIHDCYEIYYSISGGKQFLIDNRFYDFQPGDIFFINQFESHSLSLVDKVSHERIILSIYPDYLKQCSTPQTDLNFCFTYRSFAPGHILHLTPEEQKRFLYYIHKLSSVDTFGQDILEHAIFLELMTFLNGTFFKRCTKTSKVLESPRHSQIDDILSYVNQNLTEDLTLKNLSSHFFLSSSYLCRIFKEETGTTINRYIRAKRIAKAKSLLAEGYSVSDTYTLCGFNDYSNFLKLFTQAVGISPKKYSQYET